MNEWQVVGLALVGLALVGALSAISGAIEAGRRQQAMVANENRRRLNVARRYFGDRDLVRGFRDRDGVIMSIHREDGAAIVFEHPGMYAGHVYTGPGRAS